MFTYGGGWEGLRPDMPNMFCNDIGFSMSENIVSALRARYDARDLLWITNRYSQVAMHFCMVVDGDGKVGMGDMA